MSSLGVAVAAALLTALLEPGDGEPQVAALAQAEAQGTTDVPVTSSSQHAPSKGPMRVEAEQSAGNETTSAADAGVARPAPPAADARGAEAPLAGETVVTASRAPRLRSGADPLRINLGIYALGGSLYPISDPWRLATPRVAC